MLFFSILYWGGGGVQSDQTSLDEMKLEIKLYILTDDSLRQKVCKMCVFYCYFFFILYHILNI